MLDRYKVIYQRNLLKYKEEVKEWRANRKKLMGKAGERMDKLGVTNKEEMNNYVFAFNELSWINVDHFYHLKSSEKQLVTMKSNGSGDERVLILFKDIESMLKMSFNEDAKEYSQPNFPKKEKAVIFAYKVLNGKPMICYREIDGSEDYQLDFMETSFAEIKSILGQFSGAKKS